MRSKPSRAESGSGSAAYPARSLGRSVRTGGMAAGLGGKRKSVEW